MTDKTVIRVAWVGLGVVLTLLATEVVEREAGAKLIQVAVPRQHDAEMRREQCVARGLTPWVNLVTGAVDCPCPPGTLLCGR